MKYTQGNITANIDEAYMKRTDRETFIADNKHTGLNDANLGKYWDLVNEETEPKSMPSIANEIEAEVASGSEIGNIIGGLKEVLSGPAKAKQKTDTRKKP